MNYIITSIRLNMNVCQETDILLHKRLICPQQAAKRFAYSRLNKGIKEKTIWQSLRKVFPTLTGRNLNDAILQAKATLDSQREKLHEQVKNLDKGVDKTNEKLQRELNRSKGPRRERINAIQQKIDKLTNKQNLLQTHLDNGTVPKSLHTLNSRYSIKKEFSKCQQMILKLFGFQQLILSIIMVPDYFHSRHAL